MKKQKQSFPSKQELVEEKDYYINDLGQWVFLETYHLKRGYCCQNGCRHCPYGFRKPMRKEINPKK